MRWQFKLGARALDGAAAAVLAGAVGFAAFDLGAAMLAFFLAPIAFVATCVVLGRVDGEPLHRLAGFELQALDAPRVTESARAAGDDKVVFLFERSAPAGAVAAGDDAGQALSDAFARLKKSLH